MPKHMSQRQVKATLRDVPALWRARTPFDCNGTLRSFPHDFAGLGQLTGAWADKYVEAARKDEIVYTVVSYSTPIAWVLRDGTEVKPPVKYSVTTSKHQGRLY